MCEMCLRREVRHVGEVATMSVSTFEGGRRSAQLCCVCFRSVQSFRPGGEREVCRC